MARDLKLFTFSPGSGLFQAVSNDFVRLIGLPAQQLINRPVGDVVSLCGQEAPDQSISWREPQPVLTECRLHPVSDEAVSLRIMVQPDELDGHWRVAGVDVAATLALVLQRRELRAELSLVVDRSRLTMWRYDYVRDHLVWDPQASAVLNVPERDLPTDLVTLLRWVPESERAAFRDAVHQIRDAGYGRCEIVSPAEVHRHLVFRGQVWDREVDGTSRRAVGVLEDVTAARELERQRVTVAAVDPLTGLENRRAFDRALREEMRRAQSAGSPVSVILLFVDRFGKFAAQVGSSIADQAVMAFGRTLATAAKGERLYRFDGASFGVIACGVDPIGAEPLMHALLERTSSTELRQALGHSFAVTAGCASWDGEVELKAAELLRRAERALLRAQEDGGARGYSYETAVGGHDELRDAVGPALKNGEFELYYQPVIGLGDERIVGLQAQVQWNRGPGQTLGLAAFSRALESSDIAREFGRWALGAATQQLAVWERDEHLDELWVKVDITPEYADHPRLCDDVARVLNQSGLDPSRVEIGVPATAIRMSSGGAEFLGHIKALGVRVGVNEFEAGSFPLSELARVPVDVVRIDRRFLDADEPRAQRLAELTVEAAHLYGLTVAAAGVADAATQRRLSQGHCDTAQGDHVAPPMTADAVLGHVIAADTRAVPAFGS